VCLCAVYARRRQAHQPSLDDDVPSPQCAELTFSSEDPTDAGAPADAAAVKSVLSTRSSLAKAA
jgi:hypothetical protein